MKYIVAFLIIVVMVACTKEGEVTNKSTRTIQINGKEYYFMEVVPADGERAVWLLIPKDADVRMPMPISQRVSCGKNCYRMLTAIMV